MKLTTFTRQLEECRRRWNQRSVQYVLAAARILQRARQAAGTARRWGCWIREETGMSRITVHRYLRVAEFIKANVSLSKQLADMGISKVYALSRLNPGNARHLIVSGKAEGMTDVAFRRIAARLRPKTKTRQTVPNLSRSVEAACRRLERSVLRWQHSELPMPVIVRMKLKSKLQSMQRLLDRIRRASAAAM